MSLPCYSLLALLHSPTFNDVSMQYSEIQYLCMYLLQYKYAFTFLHGSLFAMCSSLCNYINLSVFLKSCLALARAQYKFSL